MLRIYAIYFLVAVAISATLVVLGLRAGKARLEAGLVEPTAEVRLTDEYYAARDALMAKLEGAAFHDLQSPAVVVSLEEFFTHNVDQTSIGATLSPHPGPQRFFEVLSAIRDREDVADVLVEVAGIDTDLDSPYWPESHTVFIVTSAAVDDLRQALTPLQPTTVGLPDATIRRPPNPAPPGTRLVYASWRFVQPAVEGVEVE